jgi:CheY-like chemotaxis protein
VIVLTADIQESTHSECMEKGAWTVLCKPIRKGDILTAVGDALAVSGRESA